MDMEEFQQESQVVIEESRPDRAQDVDDYLPLEQLAGGDSLCNGDADEGLATDLLPSLAGCRSRLSAYCMLTRVSCSQDRSRVAGQIVMVAR